MLRYLIATALMLVMASVQPVLAEIDVVRVTPTRIPDEIRVIHKQGDKIGKFTVRLRLAGPQFVTRHLAIQWHGEEVELFSMADVVTEKEIEVRFSIPMESIASATFHLGTGPFAFKDGVAKPDLGGTSYVICPVEFLLKVTAPEAGPKAMPRSSAATSNATNFDPFAQGDRVSIENADKAVLATVAAKKLVEISCSETSIDTSRTIKFQGKDGGVEARPGSSLLIELSRPTKEFAWHAGDAPEGVGDAELPAAFTHVWCRWQSDGTLTWKCYGPHESLNASLNLSPRDGAIWERGGRKIRKPRAVEKGMGFLLKQQTNQGDMPGEREPDSEGGVHSDEPEASGGTPTIGTQSEVRWAPEMGTQLYLKTYDRAGSAGILDQRRSARKDKAAALKVEYERLTREGKHDAAAKVKLELTLNSLEGNVENFNAFIDEYVRDHERLLERIDTLEKLIKGLKAYTRNEAPQSK